VVLLDGGASRSRLGGGRRAYAQGGSSVGDSISSGHRSFGSERVTPDVVDTERLQVSRAIGQSPRNGRSQEHSVEARGKMLSVSALPPGLAGGMIRPGVPRDFETVTDERSQALANGRVECRPRPCPSGGVRMASRMDVQAARAVFERVSGFRRFRRKPRGAFFPALRART